MNTARLPLIILVLTTLVQLTAPSHSATAQVASVAATDDAFEDRVELSWTGDIPLGQFFRIQRDGEVLGIRSRTELTFVDYTGDPGVAYTYCVTPTDAAGNDGAGNCDTGRRIVFSATSVDATDRTLEDRVGVSWSDRSEVEAAYRIYRTTVGAADSTLLATLAANRVVYNDESAVTGTTYRYCIVPVDAGGFTAVPACDEGTRGAVLPPAAVAASDGQFNDRVRVTWVDQTALETGYTVYRDGTQLAALAADVTEFDDMTATSGVDADYCVSATIGGVESVLVCDGGRSGALAPPLEVLASDNTYDDRVDLTWADPGDTEDGFVVTRYRAGAVDVVFADLPADAESFADDTAEQTVTYNYCVQSFSDAGAPSRSVSVEVCDEGTRSAVLAPTAVVASDNTYEDRSEVTWASAATTAMLFNIYRDGTLVDNVPANELVYADAQIASGTEHSYCVAAMTVTGASPSLQAELVELVRAARAENTTFVAVSPGADGLAASAGLQEGNEADDVVAVRDPGAVLAAVEASIAASSGAAAAGDIVESGWTCDTGGRLLEPPSDVEATFEMYEDHVEITWTDNSSVERGHRIYRQGPADASPVLIGEANTGRVSFGDYTGVPGVTYTYSVRAFDQRGPGGESTADTDTGGRKLEAPTALQIAGDPNEMTVTFSWTDNSRAETGYEVKRDDNLIAQLAENAVVYTDTTPVIGVLHTYEVTAVDALGRSETATLEAGTVVLAPGSFSASDTYLDRVVLAWEDHSVVATEYRITRDGVQIAVVGANATGYVDTTVDPRQSYTYCATTVADVGITSANSETVCDTGTTSVVVTDAQFQRFDGSPNPTPVYSIPPFGFSVAMSGRIAVVGAPGHGVIRGSFADGEVYLYEQDPVSLIWAQTDSFLPEDPASANQRAHRFGYAVAASGNTVAVTAPRACPPATPNCTQEAGEVTILVRDPGSGLWTRTQRLAGTAGSNMGWSVALDGNTLLAGRRGGVSVYERNSEAEPFTFVNDVNLGLNIVTKIHLSGSNAIVVAGTDKVTMLYRSDNAGAWVVQSTLSPPPAPEAGWNSYFNNNGVAISEDYAFAAGLLTKPPNPANPNEVELYREVVYVYQRNVATGTWEIVPDPGGIIYPPVVDDRQDAGDNFGGTMFASGGLLAVGSSEFEFYSGSPGRIFLFSLSRGTGLWEPLYETGPDGQRRLRQILPDPGCSQYAGAGTDCEFNVGRALAVSDDKVMYAADQRDSAGDVQAGHVYLSTEPVGGLLVRPTDVAATDGEFQARVQVAWKDQALDEDGYRIFRDGKVVAEVAANSESYSDFDIAAGRLAEYCVHTFRSDLVATAGACDYGWRPPDGAISGSVRAPQAPAGSGALASVDGVDAGAQEGVDLFALSTAASPSLLSPGDLPSAAMAAATDSALICIAPDPDRSLLFDGNGGSVQIPYGSVAGAFTIEFWANRAELDANDHAVLSVGAAGSTQQVAVRFLANGTVRFSVGATNLDYVDADPLGWHHWALTKTLAGERQIIRDGVVVASDAAAASAIAGGLLVLGSDADATSYYAGTMDELRIWSEARTAVQVATLKDQRLAGDEAGLVGYWPMNQGGGGAVGDETPNGRHGVINNGVFWSATGAVKSCVLVDTQGKFTLDGIRYNEKTTFTVTPYQTERAFDPPAADITLSTQQPVENQVDFIDVTQLGVSGTIVYDGTQCPVPDADIFVDGVSRGATARDGSFTVSVSPSEDEPYRFRPSKASANDAADVHEFLPTSRSLIADGALTGVDFTSTKTRPLLATFGGSCETVANLGTVTIEVTTEDGCFNQTYQVSGELNIDLPPQRYLVRVTDVDYGEADLRADMIQYFDELGVQEVDLTNARDTLDLTYHAPIGMTISGFPAAPAQCAAYTTADGTTLPALPVLQQGRQYNISLNVVEDYGAGRICPVNNGTVAVYDALADSANTKRTYEVTDGEVLHRTVVASPNIFKGASIGGVDRSYQKSFTAVAEVPGRDPYRLTEWAIVEGVRTRNSEFVSATTDPFPLLIVHDPPGSNSSAYMEESTTTCTTVSTMYTGGGGAGGSIDIAFGYSPWLGFGVSIKNGGGIVFKAKTLAGAEYGNNGALQVCATPTEKFSTSGNTGWSGEDVYMGVALNLVFARADELGVDQCVVNVTERLAADLDPENAFETTYVYGETHIRESLMPDLTELIELSGGDPTLTGDPDGDGNEESVRLTHALRNWQSQLNNNAALKAAALDGDVENISFSAGADYEYSHVTDSTRSTTEKVRVYFDSENSIGGIVTILGYDQTFIATVTQHFERVQENGVSVQTTKGIGYTLSDDDTGDFFSVDVGTDPRYGTPVFGTVSGRSSNPWEANTQRRDWPLLSINPPVQYNVPPDEKAAFTLSLTNASESDEPREYVLTTVRPSNPGGASFSIGGTAAGGTYLVEPGETQEVTMTVSRGPSRYAYEDLEVIAYPQKEFEIWQADTRQQLVMSDTARFSIFYDAPCSDISILRPRAPWILNGAEYPDSLEIILRDFDLSGSDIFDVDRIGFQYRAAGTVDWFPGASIAVNREGAAEGDSLDAQARSWIARWQPSRDGAYDLRAYTQCSAGDQVYSETASGVVDTEEPKPLGPPQPADEVLAFGGAIMATFNEPVACSTVDFEGDDANASLTYLDGPQAGAAVTGFEAICDDNTLVLTPPDAFDWTPTEGRRMQVSLDAIADLNGNPVAEPVRWQFTVRRSAFAWAPANVAVEVSRGSSRRVEATLVNGSAQPAEFRAPATLNLLPENGSSSIPLAVSGTEGTVVAQGEHKISFVIPDTLLPGRYTSTLIATRYEDDVAKEETPLYVTADVVCRAPDWSVNPTQFEQSMTVVAQLVVDGEVSTDPGDVIVAFVGTEVRGVAGVTEPVAGTHVAQMLVYGNDEGELVQFEVWDADRCQRYRETSKAFLFRAGEKVGSVTAPVNLQAPPQSTPQAVSLAAGWTWFSTNRVAADASLNAVLAGVSAAPGDLVKSQTAYAQYDPTVGWVGPLTEIENGLGYFAKLQQSNVLMQSATAADPTDPITLNTGWTWVGYLPTVALEINEALASLSPASGDLIKSQYGFAEYVTGTGWVGSLSTLEPGLGYLTYADAGGTLIYPAAEASSGVQASVHKAGGADSLTAASTVRAVALDDGVDGISPVMKVATVSAESGFDPRDFAETMTVVAEFQRDGVAVDNPDAQIRLYAGDELRGRGHFVPVEGGTRLLAFIMAYGNEAGETLDVELVDVTSGEVERIEGALSFSPDARLGSVEEALVVESVTVEIPSAFELQQNYPNPFRGQTEIRYALPQDSPVEIEVFDVIGRRVVVLVSDAKVEAGWHTVRFDGSQLGSGTYWCRIKAGEFESVKKMVLVG